MPEWAPRQFSESVRPHWGCGRAVALGNLDERAKESGLAGHRPVGGAFGWGQVGTRGRRRAMAALGEKEWKAHAELIGRVILAWNNNVHQLLQIFIHITGLDSPLADAIFFSHQDRGQRMLIRQLAATVGIEPEAQKRLSKLLERLEKVSTGRNLAAHTIFGVSLFDRATGAWGPIVVPALRQDTRLEADFTGQFERAERELAAIYRGLEEWLLHTPFPERPWGTPPIVPPRVPQFAFSTDVDDDAE